MGDFSSILSPSVKVGLFKNRRGGSISMAKNPFLSQRNKPVLATEDIKGGAESPQK